MPAKGAIEAFEQASIKFYLNWESFRAKEKPMPEPEVGQQLYSAVGRIPPGRVVSYGVIGAILTPPLPGRTVGRLMFMCPMDLPWWRVVSREGALPIAKRAPHLAAEQRRLLEAEHVPFVGDCVDMGRCACSLDEMEAILGHGSEIDVE